MIDFELTEEQAEYRRSIIRFATSELNDSVRERDAAHEFSHEAWRKCAEFGILGLPVPAAYGGSDADPVTIAVALEALGYGCEDGGLLFSLNACMWSCVVPLVRFGSAEQKERYLPGLCNGAVIGVQGMTEPGSGSDAFSLTTRAVASDRGWVLDGAKTFITNAPVAQVFVVFASTAPERGFAGLSAFVVDRDTPGLTVGRPMQKLGLRTSPMAELVFAACAVPASAALGPTGGGMAVFNHSMDWERSFIMATAVGAMERQLQRCIDHAKQRTQFGQPIGKFQSVSNMIVDMKLRLDTSRLLVRHVAWLRHQGRPTALEAALAKLHVSEAFVQSSLDAIQLHGGYGYMAPSDTERDLRDAIGARIYSGTSEIQRTIVARRLGL